MESNHTAAPWCEYNAGNSRIFKKWRVRAGQRLICEIADLNDQDRYNATLIAAAPDLLSTLQQAIQWLRRIEQEYPGSINSDAIDKHLMPAITKATNP